MYSVNRLSSRLTFFYKWILTTIVISFNILLIIAVLFFLPKEYNDLYFAFVPFSILTSSVLLFFLVRLRNVYFTDRELYVDERKRRIAIKHSEIEKISRYFFYFYSIKYNNGTTSKSVILLPKFREVLPYFGIKEANSIRSLKKAVDTVKNQV